MKRILCFLAASMFWLATPVIHARPSDGLFSAGDNQYGELGTGAYANTNAPGAVVSSNVVFFVAAGGQHALFIENGGSLWGLGKNQYGQLGYQGGSNAVSRPALMVSNGVTAAAGGGDATVGHSLWILDDGSLWAVGSQLFGQLGDGSYGVTNNYFTTVPEMIVSSNVSSVAAGYGHSLFIKNDGSLWAMGNDQEGQLGDGQPNGFDYDYTNSPQLIVSSNVAFVAAGEYHSVFVTAGGALWGMGENNSGQLGLGGLSYTNRPTEIDASNVLSAAAGYAHTLYVKNGGTLWAMGDNSYGQLGNGTTNSSNVPIQVPVSNVVYAVAGQYSSAFVKSDGSLWTMGANTSGALGANLTNAYSLVPVEVASTNVGDIAYGDATLYFLQTFIIPPAQIEVLQGGTILTNGQTNAINFGTMAANQTGPTLTFTITNSGGFSFGLMGISVPAGFTLGGTPPSVIDAYGHFTFTVQLNTNLAGTYGGNIIISNNVSADDVFSFAITGAVTTPVGAPAISLQGGLDFGVIPVGSSAQSTLIISNGGTVDLHVTNITAPDRFEVYWNSGTIAAGGTQPVTVVFSPLTSAAYGGSLTVISDAASGVGTIPVAGFGGDDSLVLTVLANGSGTVTPNDSGKTLKAGVKYTLTAVPSSTSIFAGWTGSIVTNKNPLTFVMASNTVLEANFVPNPFLADKGSFNGLFFGIDGVTKQTAGMIKGLSITPKAAYTAALLINGATHAITGKFTIDGHATNLVKRAAAQGGNLTVQLTLTTTNSIPQVTGTVTGTNDGLAWTSLLLADQATNTLPSGEFTVLLPPDTNNQPPLLSPGGDGYALITNFAGTAKNPATAHAQITGALADGTAFNQTVPVAQDGSVPIYANLYAGKGLLLGWINLDLTNGSAVQSSSLTWIHPTEKSGLYKAGFTNVLLTNQIQISAWTNPPANLAGFTNLSILDVIGATVAQTNVVVSISSKGKIVGDEVTGTLTVKTGLVKVSGGKGAGKITAAGVLLPNAGIVGGHFVTKTNAQAFQIQ